MITVYRGERGGGTVRDFGEISKKCYEREISKNTADYKNMR